MKDVATKKEWLQSLREIPENQAYVLTVLPLWAWLICAFSLWLVMGCTPVDYPREQVRQLVSESGTASAVTMRPGLVLTARHVIPMKDLFLAKPGAKGEGAIVSEQPDVDLALLRYPLAESPCPCATLAEYEAEIDEPVFVVGYPLGIAAMVTLGHAQGVMDVKLRDDWGNLHEIGKRLVLTVGVQPGNSGGGVFVYRGGQYQLVGIMSAMMNRPGTPISFAVPLSDIKDFLAGRV